MDLKLLSDLIDLLKSKGVPRFRCPEFEFELPPPDIKGSARDDDYSPDVLDDPFTFGGPRAGVPSFRRYE